LDVIGKNNTDLTSSLSPRFIPNTDSQLASHEVTCQRGRNVSATSPKWKPRVDYAATLDTSSFRFWSSPLHFSRLIFARARRDWRTARIHARKRARPLTRCSTACCSLALESDESTFRLAYANPVAPIRVSDWLPAEPFGLNNFLLALELAARLLGDLETKGTQPRELDRTARALSRRASRPCPAI